VAMAQRQRDQEQEQEQAELRSFVALSLERCRKFVEDTIRARAGLWEPAGRHGLVLSSSPINEC